MKLDEAVSDFLAQPRVALVGASRRDDHVTQFIWKKLRTASREVIPVNPAATEISGQPCYPDLKSIPGGVTAVLVVTPATESATVVRECAELGITRVWLHRAFGRGSVSPEALDAARAARIPIIAAGCPAMFCEPVDIPHKCCRWFMRVTGKLPATVGA